MGIDSDTSARRPNQVAQLLLLVTRAKEIALYEIAATRAEMEEQKG